MKFWMYRACFIFLSLILSNSAFADTWYVRADGGTRYSVNATAGQCDGKADTAYPGSGVNQHCAFNDVRSLWDDQATYNKLQWVIAGGDTVILDNTKQWRIGFDTDGSGGEKWCYGYSGGPYGCYNPPIPAGTATQHTRILGRNYASCSNGNVQDPSRMTQIFGGHAVLNALNLRGAQYVDVECLEITRHSDCISHGYPQLPRGCSSNVPLDDFDGDGIITDAATHDVLFQDLWIHGHTDRGIIGPVGGTVTANRVNLSYNGMAGWDFDDGNATPSVNAVLKMSYTTIEWNGCNQQYPAVDTYPASSCYSQSTGGYGDGMATPANFGMDVYIDHSIFRYNTQDGEDFGHVDTGAHMLSIKNSASYANNGGQFKWGPGFTNVTFENNLGVGNCLRMSQRVPGAPSGFNSNLADFCRAQDGFSFSLHNNASVLIAGNTFVSYAPTTFDIQCTDSSCAGTSISFRNNVVRGYDNSTTYTMGGQAGGPGGFYFAGPAFGSVSRDHNLFFGVRGSCIANKPTTVAASNSATAESCIDPDFVNEPAAFLSESTLDGFNFTLDSGSPAALAGVTMAGLTTDFPDRSRNDPPSIGALESGSQVTLDSISNWPGSGSATATTSAPVAPAAPVATLTTLTVGSVSSLLQNTTFTSTVRSLTSDAVPQGAVTLFFGTYAIATAPLDATGTATWVYPAYLQKLGLVAVFNGSSGFLTSTSDLLTTNLTSSLLF